MTVGDCQRAFATAALADGLRLSSPRLAWLNQRGHLGLPAAAAPVVPTLERIFLALGGDLLAQALKPLKPLPGDFLHDETGTLIEIDEHQHFTTFRLRALELYPEGAPLGFDLQEYRELCARWSVRADRYFSGKHAVGFGPGGRQRQRAYHDALRDLAAPLLGHPPVVRVAAPERDGAEAYERVADSLARRLATPFGEARER